MTDSVLEIVRFRLRPGATTEAFLLAAAESVAPISACPGFMSRRLAHDSAGQWTDVVEWADNASAQTAADTVLTNPALAPFLSMIDETSVEMAHPTIALAHSA
jgi:hypothetical protein